MGKFKLKHAEKLGWNLVHEAEEEVIDLGGDLMKRIPASYVAEKLLQGGGRLLEQAESVDLLLERIRLHEQHLEKLEQKGASQTPVVPEAPKGDLNPNHGVPGAEAAEPE